MQEAHLSQESAHGLEINHSIRVPSFRDKGSDCEPESIIGDMLPSLCPARLELRTFESPHLSFTIGPMPLDYELFGFSTMIWKSAIKLLYLDIIRKKITNNQ